MDTLQNAASFERALMHGLLVSPARLHAANRDLLNMFLNKATRRPRAYGYLPDDAARSGTPARASAANRIVTINPMLIALA